MKKIHIVAFVLLAVFLVSAGCVQASSRENDTQGEILPSDGNYPELHTASADFPDDIEKENVTSQESVAPEAE